jgi:hypothetical protein
MSPLNQAGAYTLDARNEIIKSDCWQGVFTQVPGDLIVNPSVPAFYMLTKGSAAAVTLPAPIVTTDDYKCIGFISNSAFAHVITATGLLNTGSAAVNVGTFAAFAGANLVLMAYQGKWFVVSSAGNTFS